MVGFDLLCARSEILGGDQARRARVFGFRFLVSISGTPDFRKILVLSWRDIALTSDAFREQVLTDGLDSGILEGR